MTRSQLSRCTTGRRHAFDKAEISYHGEISMGVIGSYMSFQKRGEIYPRNEEVVAHVVMASYRRTQVR